MRIESTPLFDGLMILKLSTHFMRGNIAKFLDQACDLAAADGRDGILLDFSRVRVATHSAICGVVETMARHPRQTFAFCAVPDSVKQRMQQTGLDRHIVFFDSVAAGARSVQMRAFALTSTRAVIYCPPATKALFSLLKKQSAALADMLGRPMLIHLFAQLKQFGLRDIVIETGIYPQNFIEPLRRFQPRGQSLFYLSGRDDQRPLLLRLSDVLRTHGCPSENLLVLRGDCLGRLDLSALLQNHLDSRTDLTAISQSSDSSQENGGRLEATIASCAAFFAARSMFENLGQITCSGQRQRDEQTAYLHHLMTRTFRNRTPWVCVNDPKSFFTATTLACRGILTPLSPVGEQLEDGIWRGPKARISPRAKLSGFCYASAHSQISAQSNIRGTSVLGAYSRTEPHSLIDSCIVMPGTRVNAGHSARNQILDPAQNFNHAFDAKTKLLAMSPYSEVPTSAQLGVA